MESICASVCFVTYNDKEEVLKALNSLMHWTRGVKLKVYISDNGSSDGTPEAIQIAYPQVEILRSNKNIGFGASHNQVLPLLQSDYHFVVNPDITLQDDVVTKLCLFLKDHPEVGLVAPRVWNPDGTEQFLPKKDPNFLYLLSGRIKFLSKYRDIYTMKNTVFTQPTPVEFCSGCFMAMPTEMFRQVGGFDDRYFLYFEDADLTRMIRKTHQTIFNPDVSVTHVWGRAGAKKLKYFLIQVCSMFRYFHKWHHDKNQG